MKNVIVTTLSTLRRNKENEIITNINRYSYMDDQENEHIIEGIMTQEPGTKYFLENYDINKIIIIGSKETINMDLDKDITHFILNKTSSTFFTEEISSQDVSAYRFFLDRLSQFMKNSDKDIDVQFIAEDIDNNNSILEIINAIRGNNNDDVNIYLDVQGGNRTSTYNKNAVIGILNNETASKIHLKQVIATNFTYGQEFNPIVDETRRYKITDLVSGMNAFIRYGKTDLINKYMIDMEVDINENKLLSIMNKIDDAISLCNITALEEGIKALDEFYNHPVNEEKNDFINNIFEILKDGIKRDYEGLLSTNGEINYIELIKWCVRKDFIQQALTIIEDKMPQVYIDKGIINYVIYNEDGSINKDFISKHKKEIGGKNYEDRDANIFIGWFIRQSKDYNIEDLSDNARKKLDKNINKLNIDEEKEKTWEFLVNSQYKKDSEFINNYCKYHYITKKKDKEITKVRDRYFLLNSERIAIGLASGLGLIARQIGNNNIGIIPCYKDTIPSYQVSIPFKNEDKIHDNIKISLYTKSQELGNNPIKYDDLILLHIALRDERNDCNHASSKVKRLTTKVVKKAIECYITLLSDLIVNDVQE